MKEFITVLFILSIGVLTTPHAYGYTKPAFPSCVNPQGTLKVKYDNGTHGVPGTSQEFKGSDAVYTISEDVLTQCLCPVDGNGIQTDWWKASSLSESEIKVLESEGWIYVPDGSAWGLENAPYIAQNSSFTCKGVGGTSGSLSGSSNPSSNLNNSGTGGGNNSSAGNSVLGLASTGNILFVDSVILAGLFFLLVGFFLKFKKSLS